MNELIKVNYDTDTPTVSGRELHAALGVDTPYTQWFSRMCEYGFSEGKGYFTKMLDRSDGLPGKPRTDHILTVRMAKELCMLQRTEKGKMFREYFIAVEEAWNSPDMIMELLKRTELFSHMKAVCCLSKYRAGGGCVTSSHG